MRIVSNIVDGLTRWIDSVAGTLVGLHGWLAPPRVIRIVEGDVDIFVIQTDQEDLDKSTTVEPIRIAEGKIIDGIPAGLAESLSGSRIELVLRPDRFLFAPLELPGRAAEFLEGVVRAQIDRLTPWGVAEAAFGWSRPTQAGTDRFITTIAATALTRITPLVQAIGSLGGQSITVLTSLPEGEAVPIKILESGARGGVDIGWIRQALKIMLGAAGIGAVATVSIAAIVGFTLDAQQGELAHQIAGARVAGGAVHDAPVGSVAAGHRILEQLKHEAPSSVVVLDTLSRILPDHTYVTELRIEDNKLRLTGVTQDAPSLIGVIEKSGRFGGASFFAPTTQLPSESGEHFHIEAAIQPLDPPHS